MGLNSSSLASLVKKTVIFGGFLTIFGVSAQATLPDGFKNLHVDIPDSCVLHERLYRSHGGPFQKTDLCNEYELQGVQYLVGKVYRVVDGDTIHFYARNKLYSIRMLGIDTPELHYLGKKQPYWGERALDSLKSMVAPGDKIKLLFDKTKCDRYGRVLGHVFAHGRNLNFEQVKRGYAVNYCIAPNLKHCDQYAQAYKSAERSSLAAHRDRCFVNPYVWRKAIQNHPMDKKVKDARTGLMYSPSQYYNIPTESRVFYLYE